MQSNNESPKISIIMPTYNRAAFIVETIQSIIQQTYQNWELIIVDDGSVDNTEERVMRIKDPRIFFYKAGRIAVVGKIKNIGLKLAKGELIAFMDSDDLWAPTKLEEQLMALHQYPGAGFSLAGGYNFREKDVPLDYFYKQREGIKYDQLFILFFKSELPCYTQALMFRRKCIDVTGYFKEIDAFSDVDFILRLAKNFKGIILYKPLLFRRLHQTNYNHSSWEKNYDEGIAIINSYKKEVPAGIIHDAFFRLYINFGEDYLLNRKRKSAIGKFLIAWKNKPGSIIPAKKIVKAMLRRFKRKETD